MTGEGHYTDWSLLRLSVWLLLMPPVRIKKSYDKIIILEYKDETGIINSLARDWWSRFLLWTHP